MYPLYLQRQQTATIFKLKSKYQSNPPAPKIPLANRMGIRTPRTPRHLALHPLNTVTSQEAVVVVKEIICARQS